MSIVYNINKSKDIYSLEVSQITDFKLLYTSDNKNELISEKTLSANSTTQLNTLKDGTYLLRLNAENEDEVTEEIQVIKYLQVSLVQDIYNILCDNCTSTNKCSSISKQDEKLLKNKNIFNKVLTYQNMYLSKYTEDYICNFAKFLESSTLLSKCNIQETVNNITTNERILGSSKYDERLTKTYLYIYWAGIYLLEKDLININDSEEFEFLKEKFKYNDVLNCSCELCFDIEDLENIFNMTLNVPKIYSFQLNSIEEDINDILDVNYDLDLHSEESMLTGKNIQFNKIAKFGFLVENKLENPYQIFDMFNTNVTSEFDYVYENNKSYYLSKNYISHSNIYFKFVKN